MMFLTLAALCFAGETNLAILSEKTFNTAVLNHPANEVWFVMFYGEETNESRKAFEAFRNASETSAGMIKFARLDVARAPQVATQMELSQLPAYRIFHGTEISKMKGKPTVKNFLKVCLKFVQDMAENVTVEWKNEFTGKPSAILFTKKEKTPLWAGVSSYFAKKDVRIGICKDDEIIKAFGIETVPSVVFYNGTTQHVYDGVFKFKFVKAAIEEWFQNRFVEEEPTTDDGEMMMPDQFNKNCVGGKQMCVIAATKRPPEAMSLLMKEGARRKMKFFAGAVNLPYKFMEKGGVWFYHPRRDAFVHVADEKLLLETMDRVIDGSAKWVKRAQLETADEL